jgi:hypothetical protein
MVFAGAVRDTQQGVQQDNVDQLPTERALATSSRFESLFSL